MRLDPSCVPLYPRRHQENDAIAREKEIKGWRREKKLRLILAANPDWADRSPEWKEDESWQAVPEAKSRPMLRRRDPGEH